VEKLESVLRAEDDARSTVSDSRERAQNLLAEARVRALKLRADSDAEARIRATADRVAIIDTARAEADTIASGAASAQATTLERASGRIDAAVAALLDEMVG